MSKILPAFEKIISQVKHLYHFYVQILCSKLFSEKVDYLVKHPYLSQD